MSAKNLWWCCAVFGLIGFAFFVATFLCGVLVDDDRVKAYCIVGTASLSCACCVASLVFGNAAEARGREEEDSREDW